MSGVSRLFLDHRNALFVALLVVLVTFLCRLFRGPVSMYITVVVLSLGFLGALYAAARSFHLCRLTRNFQARAIFFVLLGLNLLDLFFNSNLASAFIDLNADNHLAGRSLVYWMLKEQPVEYSVASFSGLKMILLCMAFFSMSVYGHLLGHFRSRGSKLDLDVLEPPKRHSFTAGLSQLAAACARSGTLSPRRVKYQGNLSWFREAITEYLGVGLLLLALVLLNLVDFLYFAKYRLGFESLGSIDVPLLALLVLLAATLVFALTRKKFVRLLLKDLISHGRR